MENGEVLWRPLNNPSIMQHQRFATKNLRGFGLLQRDRNFATYQDLFNLYHLVPSVWVEPRGYWGEGDVNLVELSTRYEGLDNIVAFWDPKIKPTRWSLTVSPTPCSGRAKTDMKLSPKPQRHRPPASAPKPAIPNVGVRHRFRAAATLVPSPKAPARRPSPVAARTAPDREPGLPSTPTTILAGHPQARAQGRQQCPWTCAAR